MSEPKNKHGRTERMYNLHLVNTLNCHMGKHGMPMLDPVDVKPEALRDATRCTRAANFDKQAGVHFFLDDYRFDGTWKDPIRYVPMLERFGCAIAPDYSLYLEMPEPIHRWNVYRQRTVSRVWQDAGIPVVPVATFCEKGSYVFCVDGIPQGSTVAISTVGLMDCAEGIEFFRNGASYAARMLEPLRILAYGKQCDFDNGKAEVVWYPSEQQGRFSELRRLKQEEKQAC